MQVTLEISKYPLSEDYETRVLDFIARINTYENLVIKTNATSTHVMGEYDYTMGVIQKEMKTSFEKYGKAIFVVKVLMGGLLK